MLDGSTWDHEYVISDHLGNTRVRFHDDNGNGTISSGELLSTHDYYPFGMEWNENNYKYKFNNVERETGLEINLGLPQKVNATGVLFLSHAGCWRKRA